MRFYCLVFFALLLTSPGCGDDDGAGGPPDPADSFDRGALLAFYADNIITPAYVIAEARLGELSQGLQTFAEMDTPDADGLLGVQNQLAAAYEAWQHLSVVTTSVAESLQLHLLLNAYPTNATYLDAASADDSFQLPEPNRIDVQGLPALEYLLFGPGNLLLDGTAAPDRRYYAAAAAVRAHGLVAGALGQWQGTFRDAFVQNSGNSATASLDRMVNDFIFNYERHTRAGKVGIPAGVFSNEPLPENREAPYTEQSLRFLLSALERTHHFLDNPSNSHNDLAAYLDALGVERDGELLSRRITDQLEVVIQAVTDAAADDETVFTEQPAELLSIYDEMQRLLVLLKIDMMQALNIQVDFVDADGD